MEAKATFNHSNGTTGILFKTALEELVDSRDYGAISETIAAKERALADAEENAEFCKGTEFGDEEAQRAARLRRDIEKLKSALI